MLGEDEIYPGGVRESIADRLAAYRLAVWLGAAFLALTVAVQMEPPLRSIDFSNDTPELWRTATGRCLHMPLIRSW